MIPEIGIMVGLFILTSLLTPKVSGGKLLLLSHSLLSAIAVLVAVAVIGDLSYKSTRELLPQRKSVVEDSAKTASNPGLPSPPRITVHKSSPGGFEITFPYLGVRKVAETNMKREWSVIEDPSVPARLDKETSGVRVIYKTAQYGSGDSRWSAKYGFTAAEALNAIEIRFLVFDVWGNRLELLSQNEIADIAKGEHKELSGEWRLYPENNAVDFFASLAYVARVRLQDGRIIEAKPEQILDEIRKFSSKFKPEELEPVRPGATPPPTAFAANK